MYPPTRLRLRPRTESNTKSGESTSTLGSDLSRTPARPPQQSATSNGNGDRSRACAGSATQRERVTATRPAGCGAHFLSSSANAVSPNTKLARFTSAATSPPCARAHTRWLATSAATFATATLASRRHRVMGSLLVDGSSKNAELPRNMASPSRAQPGPSSTPLSREANASSVRGSSQQGWHACEVGCANVACARGGGDAAKRTVGGTHLSKWTPLATEL
jgi:hypothetical protein